MNRTDLLQHIAALRDGNPLIISPGLANYPIAEAKDEALTIYNMDMPYTTPMALGMALGWPERKVIAIEGDGVEAARAGIGGGSRERGFVEVIEIDRVGVRGVGLDGGVQCRS